MQRYAMTTFYTMDIQLCIQCSQNQNSDFESNKQLRKLNAVFYRNFPILSKNLS